MFGMGVRLCISAADTGHAESMARVSLVNVTRPFSANFVMKFIEFVPSIALDMERVLALGILADANATLGLLGMIALRQTCLYVTAIAVEMVTV